VLLGQPSIELISEQLPDQIPIGKAQRIEEVTCDPLLNLGRSLVMSAATGTPQHPREAFDKRLPFPGRKWQLDQLGPNLATLERLSGGASDLTSSQSPRRRRERSSDHLRNPGIASRAAERWLARQAPVWPTSV
jgi:hypothetical protein